MCQCGRRVPGLDLETEDDFDFSLVFAALGNKRFDDVVNCAREFGAVEASGKRL